jgi:hypothetical protein
MDQKENVKPLGESTKPADKRPFPSLTRGKVLDSSNENRSMPVGHGKTESVGMFLRFMR